jgi:hypothetical protein
LDETGQLSDPEIDQVPLARRNPRRAVAMTAQAICEIPYADNAEDAYLHALVTTSNDVSIPITVEEALNGSQRENWQGAIDSELQSLYEQKTWEDTEEVLGRREVKSKWVFDLKRDEFGKIERYKARLVARGDQQHHGLDYNETFSPTLRLESFRMILAWAVRNGKKVHQLDVKTAFLRATIDKVIYMRLPTINGQKGKLVMLLKSLYGLKQAGYLWNKDIDRVLVSIGFKCNDLDNTVYILIIDGRTVMIGVYVDDLVIAGEENDVQWTKCEIKAHYECKDGGELHHMLHIKVRLNVKNKTAALSQPAYIQEVLEETGMMNAKPLDCIIYTAQDEYNTKPLSERQVSSYRSLIGKLMWIARASRPDLAHVLHLLSRKLSKPTQVDWENAKKVLRYLKGTLYHGIILGGDHKLMGYADANWITPGDLESKSTSGYVFTIGGPVSWSSKRQSIPSFSSTESEYAALTHAGRESRWIEQLAKSMRIDSEEVIHCDNQSAIKLASNNTYHARTKHIAIRYHWIKYALENAYFKLRYIPTKEQLADIFTKILPRGLHKEMMSKLKILNTNEQ